MGRLSVLSLLFLTSFLAAGPAAGATATPLLAPSPAVVRAGPDEGDEQYQYLVGLAERGMHDRVVREGVGFLKEHARHPKADLARYRVASSLFALGRRDEAREQFARLAGRQGFQFESEVHFRLGQCELSGERAREAAEAFERVIALDEEYLRVPARFFLAEARFRLEQFDQAEQGYREVLSADGRGEYARDASYGIAWCAFRRGQHADAVARTADFLKRWGDDELAGEMRFLQGEALLATGQPTEAVAAYRKVRSGPFADAALRGAAFALSEVEDHAAAAGQFEALLERSPDGRYAGEAALHAGVEWMRAGDHRRALKALSDRRVPRGPEGLYWRGQAELAGGDARAALESIDRALKAGPQGDLADRLHVARGSALSAMGRGSEAADSFARSGSEYALYAAAIEALNAREHDDAARMARSLVERFPHSSYRVEAELVLGEALFAQGQFAAAEQAFGSVDAEGAAPALVARALSRRAWCRWEQGDGQGAADLFGQVEERASRAGQKDAPELAEARFMRGRCLEAAGDEQGAHAAWERYLAAHPDGKWRSQALFGMARLDEPEAAIARLEQLLARDPDGELAPQANFELAERLVAVGRVTDARPRYAVLVEDHPQSELAPRARYGLAWCAYEAQDFAAAAAALRGFEQLEPMTPELRDSGLELRVWACAKSGDARGSLEAFRAYGRAGGDGRAGGNELRVLGAAKVAVATLVEAGRTDDAQALIAGLLERVRSRTVAASLLVEHAWIALDGGHVDEAEESVYAARKIADAAVSEDPSSGSNGSHPSNGSGSAAGGTALAEAAFFVGEARFEAGDHRRAAELYTLAAARGTPEVSARALYKEGFARLAQDDEAGAARAFAALVERHPTSQLTGEALFLLGEAHYRAERFEQAVAALERLRREQPRHDVMPN